MNKVFKDYLFTKHILVSEKGEDTNAFETLFAIANMFNIRVKKGQALAEREMIEYISGMIGKIVPEPFYKGFPESVKKLSTDKLIFDQMVHYAVTYGFGNFSEAGHSLFEEQFERTAFKENAEIKDFSILNIKDAEDVLKTSVKDMFLSTRPLNPVQYNMLSEYIDNYGFKPETCASKNLALRLLAEKRDGYYVKFISLSDVTKLAEEINYRIYQNKDINNLNLKNRDRKLIASVLDMIFYGFQFESDKSKQYKQIRDCFERKAVWSGLLHHIHYIPKNDYGTEFVKLMRGKENHSVYSAFEKAMKLGYIEDAANILKTGKGSGAVLRNLDYLISRCANEEDIKKVLDQISTQNVMILIQLLIKYSATTRVKAYRAFSFTKYEKLRVHVETKEELARRRTFLDKATSDKLKVFIKKELEKVLKNRLGKVYIDDNMKNIALPVQETASSGGFGVLAKGSRLHIDDFKKIRAFTYWEKVNDIDLSCFGLTDDGRRIEFSWRTMAGLQSDAIVYSGDQTSGYKGGSEYFDIDLLKFKNKYPDVKYVIFCNNVFSPLKFCDCFCKAGYMIRDVEDSGQIFEPKTVATSFIINSDSTFAYLFGLDLEKNDLIWLNMNRDSSAHVAGETPLAFLIDQFFVTDVINVKSFFEMMASNVVNDIKEANVIVSDTVNESELSDGCRLIRSYDFEKMTALMG
ncbi:MAG: TerD family protein [Lachnospiraceae bacterium]|nr:TerD family protein [Lachnospiraceae bacterium]